MKLLAILLLLPLTLLAEKKQDRLILVGASYGKNILAICEPDGSVIWSHKTEGPKSGHTGHHDLQLLPNGNILFHDSWSVTSEITPKKEIVWKHDSKGANVHAFQRLANGDTMIAESGLGRIVHLDKAGKITKEVPLPKDGRHQTRMLEILPNGHYLSCAENPGVVTEYDSTGKIVWEYATKTRVFGAIRLKNGNTLIASGSGNSILEVSPDKKVVWEMAKKIPGTDIELAWTTDLQELPNGNLVIGNCHAGDKNPQIVELDKDRKVVWTFDQFELVGNGLACWEVLDAKQTALVRTILKKDGSKKKIAPKAKAKSPISLLKRRQPNHPALKLGLESKSPFEAYQAITAPDFLATLNPNQTRSLAQLRDVLAANLRVAGHPNFPPPADYQIQNHLGWSIFLHNELKGEKLKRALQLLDQQLQAIIDRVPAPAVAYLQQVPLFFTPAPDGHSGACHHPSSTWLKNNNKPVEMAKSVEFTNVENFEHETRRMPNFVLHELAHAYHNHLLGDDQPDILTAFNAAKKTAAYQNLPKRTGDLKNPYKMSKGEVYAMTNQMEYFAETTEAYFHENDIFPHHRAQLIEHDPKVIPVLEKVWGVKKATHPVLAANRIVFLGDSITAARDFVINLQAALHLQGHTPEVISIGLGSEGVTGLTEPGHPFPRPDVTERLDRALAKTKPDLVIACYGMNDGIYHPYSDARFHAYQKGIQSLIEKVKASGAKLILITPPPFDVEAPGAKKDAVDLGAPVFSWRTIYKHYDRDVIARYAKYILSLKPQVTDVIDVYTPISQHMTGTRKTKPDYTLSNDGVHINPLGHHIMAGAIYQGLFKNPLPELPADLVKFYKSRQSYLSPAWLTHTGHTRPGVKTGLPLKEAQARAAFTIR